MKYQVRMSQEVIWCEQDDRYILVVKFNDEIIGLNFMQGEELDLFLAEYNNIDEELTKFYRAIHHYLSGATELDRINQAIWGYFGYKNPSYT